MRRPTYGKDECRPGRKMGHFILIGDNSTDEYSTINWFEKLVSCSRRYVANDAASCVIMGSDSDWPVMEGALDALRSLGVGVEATVVSAHRTPDRLMDYAKSARDRGLDVIIAGAGGAAHLPGMIAAAIELPVIGVPVVATCLNGEDSLLSIVQMPTGVPVATVAINGAYNAGLLAAQMSRQPTTRFVIVSHNIRLT